MQTVVPPGKPHDHESYRYEYAATGVPCPYIHTTFRLFLNQLADPFAGFTAPFHERRAYLVDRNGVLLAEVWNGLAFCWTCGYFIWDYPRP